MLKVQGSKRPNRIGNILAVKLFQVPLTNLFCDFLQKNFVLKVQGSKRPNRIGNILGVKLFQVPLTNFFCDFLQKNFVLKVQSGKRPDHVRNTLGFECFQGFLANQDDFLDAFDILRMHLGKPIKCSGTVDFIKLCG